jgi:D-2-hydroxyglutarate dehydrogenase
MLQGLGRCKHLSSLLARRGLHHEALAELRQLLGSRGVMTDPVALQSHNYDWFANSRGSASVVLAPSCTQEVSKVLSFCNDRHIPVVPQGGNTGVVGGAIASHKDEVVLSLSRMNSILEFSGVWHCSIGHPAFEDCINILFVWTSRITAS